MKKRVSLYLMIFLYVATGLNHFIMPSFYTAIVPYYIPYPAELVFITGILQILLGLLLIRLDSRRIAAWMIILMLIVFMPVHIQMLIDNSQTMGISFWVAFARIPIQFALIYWAWTIARKKDTSGL